ncbi:MAG TPA: hypothetical protein VHS06_07710 [Chloroflexota bacterium]|nr:hypothetical protein [Chloroflexota bacterium]
MESWLQETAQSLGVELQFFQSNWEGATCLS